MPCNSQSREHYFNLMKAPPSFVRIRRTSSDLYALNPHLFKSEILEGGGGGQKSILFLAILFLSNLPSFSIIDLTNDKRARRKHSWRTFALIAGLYFHNSIDWISSTYCCYTHNHSPISSKISILVNRAENV